MVYFKDTHKIDLVARGTVVVVLVSCKTSPAPSRVPLECLALLCALRLVRPKVGGLVARGGPVVRTLVAQRLARAAARPA